MFQSNAISLLILLCHKKKAIQSYNAHNADATKHWDLLAPHTQNVKPMHLCHKVQKLNSTETPGCILVKKNKKQYQETKETSSLIHHPKNFFKNDSHSVVLILLTSTSPTQKMPMMKKKAGEITVTYHISSAACLQPLNRSSWGWQIWCAWRLRATVRLWWVLRYLNHQKLWHGLCHIVHGAEIIQNDKLVLTLSEESSTSCPCSGMQ